MEIKNTSFYTIDEIEENLLFISKIKIKPFRIFFFLSLAFLILTFVLCFIEGSGFEENWYYPVIFLVCGFIFGLFGFFLPKLIRKNNQKRVGEGVKYEYVFYDDEFVIKSSMCGQTSTSTIKYNSLVKVAKTEKTMFLFIDKIQAFMVKIEAFADSGFSLVEEKLKGISAK